jgi:hypothetical protein
MNFWLRRAPLGFKFFHGNEPWLEGLHKVTWQNFFGVCTDEMDDLSEEATKLVIEYCLEILEVLRRKSTESPHSPTLKPL